MVLGHTAGMSATPVDEPAIIHIALPRALGPTGDTRVCSESFGALERAAAGHRRLTLCDADCVTRSEALKHSSWEGDGGDDENRINLGASGIDIEVSPRNVESLPKLAEDGTQWT